MNCELQAVTWAQHATTTTWAGDEIKTLLTDGAVTWGILLIYGNQENRQAMIVWLRVFEDPDESYHGECIL